MTELSRNSDAGVNRNAKRSPDFELASSRSNWGRSNPGNPNVEKLSSSDRPLLSTTLETIRSDLDRQLLYTPEFVIRYFPAIATRGFVTLSDVEGMNRTQADAMAFSLGRSLRCFAREEERQRVRRIVCPPVNQRALPASKNLTKALSYVSALRNLCDAYGLETVL